MIKTLTIYCYAKDDNGKYILSGMVNTQYDPLGNETEYSRYKINDNKYIMDWKHVNIYDLNGNLTESQYGVCKTIFKYDTSGNKVDE